MTELIPAPTFDSSFPHNWTAEILRARPLILPSRHYVYPGQVEEVERGALEILIRPGGEQNLPDGQSFLATCALGFRDSVVPTGLWTMPHPDWLCAVAGGYAYLIDTTHPGRFTMLSYRPVLSLLPYNPGPAGESLLLFVSHRTILAWGRDGQAWETAPLSSEGISSLCIEDSILHGLGWNLMTDSDTLFALDLRTGKKL